MSAVTRFKEVRESVKQLKEFYRDAKSFERKGKHEKAVEYYNSAIDTASELQSGIDEIENEGSFKVALIAVQKKEKRFKKVQFNAIRNVIISAFITGAITLGIHFWRYKVLEQKVEKRINTIESKYKSLYDEKTSKKTPPKQAL